jgi:hypothetical protein
MTNRIPDRIRRTIPAAAAATAISAQALAIRFFLDADESRVYWLGRPVEIECAFRARFGLPCPGCGLTRSIVLGLHGHLLRAWNVAPGGAAAVTAAVAFGVGLLVLAVLNARDSSFSERCRVSLRRFALVLAGLVFAVWAGGWATAFTAAYHRHF